MCNISQLSDKNATFMLTTYMQIDEEVVGFYNRQMTRHILVSRIKVIYPKYRLFFDSLPVKPKYDKMNYMFSKCYFISNCSEQIQNNPVLPLRYCRHKFVAQCYVILWVNWWVKKYIWQRITFDIKTQMNLVHLSFLGRLGRSGSSEKFCSFAKVSYCWGRFVQIFMGKTNAKLDFLYIVVSALKSWFNIENWQFWL